MHVELNGIWLYGLVLAGCSGDHDLLVPHLGTQAWVRSLNFSIVDEWRAWHLGGQSAGWVWFGLGLMRLSLMLILFLICTEFVVHDSFIHPLLS
jgi:hypothetical protein